MIRAVLSRFGDDLRAFYKRGDAGLYHVAGNLQILYGGFGIDLHARDLLGKVSLGVGDGRAPRHEAGLRLADRVCGGKPEAVGLDAVHLEVRACRHCDAAHQKQARRQQS